jgi:hypothetical protein
MTEFDQLALDWMRQMIADTLPARAMLYSPIYSPDDGGGGSIVWQLIAEEVPCRLDALRNTTSAWELLGDSQSHTTYYRGVFRHDAPIQPDMRIVIDGASYRVLRYSHAHTAKLVVHVIIYQE